MMNIEQRFYVFLPTTFAYRFTKKRINKKYRLGTAS
jgi:hypothetical protein